MNNKTYLLVSSILMILGLAFIIGMITNLLPWPGSISLIVGVVLILLAGVVRLFLFKEDQ